MLLAIVRAAAGASHTAALPLLNFHLAMHAGNPDLFRARFGCGLPVERVVHHLPHARKPPRRAAGAMLPLRCRRVKSRAIETQFQLLIRHNLPFVTDESKRRGWTNTV